MTSSTEEHRVLHSEELFRGAIVTLRRDTVRMSDGSTADREVVSHLGAVGVVALDDENRVVLVNQYRHPVGQRLDEIPAGLLDVAGEAALPAAQRELAEEARLQAADWRVLVDLYTSPGFSDEAIRIYLARELSPAPDSAFRAEHEELTMTSDRVPLADAVAAALSGRLTNAAAVAGVLAAALAAAGGFAELRAADAVWPARPGR